MISGRPRQPARVARRRLAGIRPRRSAAERDGRTNLQSGLIVIPSALTILAICAGLSAVRFAGDDKIDLALALVVGAALLDGIDGRVARLMGATTKIGAEIDSLADAINFGVVPALIVYVHLMPGEDVGWLLALVYCCAIVLRLARFNTINDDENAPGYTKDFFVGVPAPAAAIIALLPIAVAQQFGDGWWTSVGVVGAWLIFSAFLAVSRIPTSSLKATSRISRAAIAPIMVVIAGAAALLVTYPYVLMEIAIIVYLAHIPFAWRNRRWVAARPDQWDRHPRERRADRKELGRATPKRRSRLPVRRKSQARLGLRRPT
ncbi:CDP-alcohol phosphatidyltransferase family protein [Gordonia sp. CPCC 205333]|uniref:CDP-alcohol phosphatidyltransferase family protein n=1 Tax=Gordonia sp. CPCC 205333 TaxID=3140790 RepID=UPI003AF4095A